jgi:hypothetical protein
MIEVRKTFAIKRDHTPCQLMPGKPARPLRLSVTALFLAGENKQLIFAVK